MKKFLPFIFLLVFLVSCGKQDSSQWEYKVIRYGEELSLQEYSDNIAKKMAGMSGVEATGTIQFTDPQTQMNELGKEGWELVTSYTTIETLFPNYGDKSMHTGIKSNTRTESIYFVFKRKYIPPKEDKTE